MPRLGNDAAAKSFRIRYDSCRQVDPFAAPTLRPGDTDLENDVMKATIFHNPGCGTSRKTLAILISSGADVTVREYLNDSPSRDELEQLYSRAGISPRDGLRSKEALASELGLNQPDVNDGAILDAMADHPILINRPLVQTDKGVRLCRPQDIVREIL